MVFPLGDGGRAKDVRGVCVAESYLEANEAGRLSQPQPARTRDNRVKCSSLALSRVGTRLTPWRRPRRHDNLIHGHLDFLLRVSPSSEDGGVITLFMTCILRRAIVRTRILSPKRLPLLDNTSDQEGPTPPKRRKNTLVVDLQRKSSVVVHSTKIAHKPWLTKVHHIPMRHKA